MTDPATDRPAQIIGRNVKARRLALGISARELGERLAPLIGREWPRQAVYLAEHGDRAFTADTLTALAVALETTVTDLMDPRGDVVTLPSGAPVPPSTWAAPAAGVSAAAADVARHAVQAASQELERAAAHLGGAR